MPSQNEDNNGKEQQPNAKTIGVNNLIITSNFYILSLKLVFYFNCYSGNVRRIGLLLFQVGINLKIKFLFQRTVITRFAIEILIRYGEAKKQMTKEEYYNRIAAAIEKSNQLKIEIIKEKIEIQNQLQCIIYKSEN